MQVLNKKLNQSFPSFLTFLFICLVSLVISGCSGGAKNTHRGTSVGGAGLLEIAEGQLGLQYKYGGISPKTGFDCSGFVMWVHKRAGINIAREASDQFKRGEKVKRNNLRAGDIVFFETYKPGPSHVGIYDGRGSFIHSPNSKSRVKYTKLSNSYYKKRYLGARRYW